MRLPWNDEITPGQAVALALAVFTGAAAVRPAELWWLPVGYLGMIAAMHAAYAFADWRSRRAYRREQPQREHVARLRRQWQLEREQAQHQAQQERR